MREDMTSVIVTISALYILTTWKLQGSLFKLSHDGHSFWLLKIITQLPCYAASSTLSHKKGLLDFGM